MNRLLSCLLILVLLTTPALAHHHGSCHSFCHELRKHCKHYIRTNALHAHHHKPSKSCCSAVKKVSTGEISKNPKKLCKCLKKLVKKTKHCDGHKVASLPKKCGLCVKFPPVTRKTKCKHLNLSGYGNTDCKNKY